MQHLKRPSRAAFALGVVPAVVALAVTAPAAFAADPTVGCRPVPPGTHNLTVARQVYDTGRSMNVTDRVMLAGFETALVESNVNNCTNGDLDSVGVFQQRDSWGSRAERTTVSIAARKFFAPATTAAARHPDWSAGTVAQSVQRSAFPSRYDQREAEARRLIDQARGVAATPPQLSTTTVGAAAAGGTASGWTVRANGTVTAYGGAATFGDAHGVGLNQPVVGMASTPDGAGYWLVARDGGVFSFGNAPFEGSMGGQPLNRPVVGMGVTPSGRGYWLVAADGGIFSFGDAGFFGSMGGQALNQPVVGMAATPSGRGYWLVAADGGIFGFGDAGFFGSMGGQALNQPVVGMAARPDGGGYWLVAADGGIFSFGSAVFRGAATGTGTQAVGMAPSGTGYQVVLADGRTVARG